MKLTQIFKAFKWSFLLTSSLILLESAANLLFPLFIGYAIDDAIAGSYQGSMQLGILGVAILVVGASRRLFDSRFYSKVLLASGTTVISKIEKELSSIKTARLGMIREMIEFMENALPELVNNLIGLIGVVLIIATLNLKVFLGCLSASLVIGIIYMISSSTIFRFNKAYNDEIEKQVNIINTNSSQALSSHLHRMMKWNIKLSDLETLNFSISWMVLMVFLVLSIMVSVGDGIVQYGAIFALIMYVFQYMESIVSLPLYYQQWLRLQEIKARLR